jgi:hypothetical protein
MVGLNFLLGAREGRLKGRKGHHPTGLAPEHEFSYLFPIEQLLYQNKLDPYL